MLKLIAYGEEVECTRTEKGSDYLRVYKDNQLIREDSGIRDFSGYKLVDEDGNPMPWISLEDLRTQKLVEVSNACTETIYAGIDLETSQGTEYFALTLEDQNNILNLLLQVQAGLSSVPYHADGQSCRPFTAEEITALAAAATQFKTYQLTYCNQLNTWIRRETDYNALEGITYGVELPADLATNMDAMMALSTANTGA